MLTAQLLLKELNRRKQANASYSLRAFARDLGVSPTVISQVLSRKRDLSNKNLIRVADRLGLTPKQLQFLQRRHWASEESSSIQADSIQLRDDEFCLISDWYYFGLLNLAYLPANQSSPKWIAKRLGISVTQAQEALERLIRLNHLEVRKGKLIRLSRSIKTVNDVPSSALRSHHRQNLLRAQQALEQIPVDRREMNSVTLAFDSKRIAEAKQLIREFKDRFENLFEASSPDQIYTLAIQFFPPTGSAE